MDYGEDGFYAELAQDAVAGWRAWNDLSGELLFDEVGVGFLCSTPLTDGGYELDSFLQMQQLGVPVERLGESGIKERFPALNRDLLVDGYFNPTAGVARASAVMEWLADQTDRCGCRLDLGERVHGIAPVSQGRVAVHLDCGRRLSADRVVIATGAWTARLLPELATRLRTTGQLVTYFRVASGAMDPPPSMWAVDLATSGWFGFPPVPCQRAGAARGDLVVKIANHGAGLGGHPGMDWTETALAPELAKVARFVERFVPRLRLTDIDATHVCYYTDMLDGDFLIDAVPGRPGVFVATGGSGHAFKFAPRLGELVVRAMEGNAERRFGWRSPDRALATGAGRSRGEAARAGRTEAFRNP